MEKQTREKLIKEFMLMRDFEVSARDYYLKIASESSVKNEELKKEFKNIAADEQKHIAIVDKIIDLIETSL